jgi:hypothetical protein
LRLRRTVMPVGSAAKAPVKVRRRWNDNNVAEVSIAHLRELHYRNEAGGVCGAFPRAFLCARVWCDHLPQGALNHVCNKATAPHELIVYILPADNPADLYETLR